MNGNNFVGEIIRDCAGWPRSFIVKFSHYRRNIIACASSHVHVKEKLRRDFLSCVYRILIAGSESPPQLFLFALFFFVVAWSRV